ncbi:hypothetical protein LMH87_010636 [Akanthomyces muscarius]|uniref:Uncharacterized protein n=1 Tax=Akanthomyces muscarius TaxID=2231603 RepID=A0A9W8QDN9_AKAMU|nr:hypothetical protein LMH87_010636 [Akanthomyces muscarius]KAJ4154175.1 hypothetical protein LMH87_010636 [Akanthomyces muscarius]
MKAHKTSEILREKHLNNRGNGGYPSFADASNETALRDITSKKNWYCNCNRTAAYDGLEGVAVLRFSAGT